MEECPPPKRAKVIAREQQRKIRLIHIGRCLAEGLLPCPELCDIVKEYANQFDGIKLLTYHPNGGVFKVGFDRWFAAALAVLEDGNLAFSSQSKAIIFDVDKGLTKFQLSHSSDNKVLVEVLLALKGNKLASGSTDHTVRVWDASTGKCIFTLSGHESRVCTLTLLQDGTLASSSDQYIHVWDLSTGSLLKHFHSHANRNDHVVVGLDNGLLAMAGAPSATVRVFDVCSGATLHCIEGRATYNPCLCVLPDNRLASAARDGSVWLWHNLSGSVTFLESEPAGRDLNVRMMIPLPNAMLATVCNDFIIRLWNTNNATCVHTLNGHTAAIMALILMPDGKLVSSALDFTLRVWDCETCECVRTIKTNSCVTRLAVLPGCKLVGTGYDCEAIYMWG